MKSILAILFFLSTSNVLAGPAVRPRAPLSVQAVDNFQSVNKTLYYVYKSAELWKCSMDEGFMDRVVVMEDSSFNFCDGEQWATLHDESYPEVVNHYLLLEDIKRFVTSKDISVHRWRVAKFWYLNADTSPMPEELRDPRKEKILVCDTPKQCEVLKQQVENVEWR